VKATCICLKPGQPSISARSQRLMPVLAWTRIHGCKWTQVNKNEWNNGDLAEVWESYSEGARMLKLKSCRGELLMLSIVPTDAASYRLSFSHTHTHTRTCAHTQTQLQSPVACADRKQRTCHSVWIWGMCKCSVVSGPNERDVCSCCLNGECSVCA